MSEMIERVAKHIYDGRNGRGCKPWGHLPRAHQEPYLVDARAAIEAMREPTEAMEEAALDVRPLMMPDTPRELWEAMIDAALNT